MGSKAEHPEYGKLLKKLREQLNVTQSKFADTMKVSVSLISQMEQGAVPVSEKFQYAVARHFLLEEDWCKTGDIRKKFRPDSGIAGLQELIEKEFRGYPSEIGAIKLMIETLFSTLELDTEYEKQLYTEYVAKTLDLYRIALTQAKKIIKRIDKHDLFIEEDMAPYAELLAKAINNIPHRLDKERDLENELGMNANLHQRAMENWDFMEERPEVTRCEKNPPKYKR
jgi:transcriptional regulator with XRE-family HTH domain